MERELNLCTHTFDDGAALLKESMRKETWQLKRTCARCGAVLYPTKGTLTLMGVVDRMNYLFGMVMGVCTKNMLPPDLTLFANLLICLAVLLLSSRILEVATRLILLVARWQPMEERIRDVPREDVLREWYGKTMFLTLICFVAMVAVIYYVMIHK